MKFEGLFKLTKRNPHSIAGKIIGLQSLISSCSMEFAIKDPQSVENVGKITVEIPDVKKPEPKRVELPKVESKK